MKKWFWRTSISRLLILAFILLILLPMLFVCGIFSNKIYKAFRQNVDEHNTNAVKIIVMNISERAHIIERLNRNNTYNNSLLIFLKRNYWTNPVKSYTDYLRMAGAFGNQSTYTRSLSGVQQRIFMKNGTIPEGFGCFYRIERIENMRWYKDFIASDEEDIWLYGDVKTYFTHITEDALKYDERFIHLRKIRDYRGEFLGIASLEIEKDFIMGDCDLDGLLIEYTPANTTLLNTTKADIAYANASVIAVDVPKLALRVSLYEEASLGRRLYYQLMTAPVVAIVGMGILLLLFLYILRRCMAMMKQCLHSIEASIQGNEPIILPEMGTNEFGQILHSFNALNANLKQNIADRIAAETMEKEAELRRIQSSISPHFFYNTLDIISSAMLIAGQDDIADAVSNFASMLRYAFRGERMSNLDKEFRCTRDFYIMQNIRYNGRVHLTCEIEPYDKIIECPKFILQPIVENCIRHGMKDAGEALHIEVCARREGALCVVTVKDDGKGIPQAQTEQLRASFKTEGRSEDSGFGIGLFAVDKILKHEYGEDNGLSIESEEGHGTLVTLKIPVKGVEMLAEDSHDR